MPTHSTAQRLLPHLRRVALGRDTEVGDGQLLGQFVVARDGDAFAALVRRHGPMVLGVCRRVVGDSHLAEDAFQATFLVLARRAATVRPRHLVGHWLYGVAYRTALKARASAARRKAKENQVDAMPQPPVSPPDAWADLQPVLDAELARLPDKYRIPVVLCDLGGRPQRDVARELGLPPATLANRLASARRLLAKRLTDRGVALSAGAVAAALGWHAATSAVPASLSAVVVKAACAAAAGAPVGLPVPVVQLSEGVMRMFVLSKLKAVAAGVASCLLLLAGLGLIAAPTLRAGPDDKPVRPADHSAKPADPQRTKEPEDLLCHRPTRLAVRGTVPAPREAHYFLADKDPRKRDKRVEWMLAEHGNQKITAMCASCHQGKALWDLDRDGWLDPNVAGKAHQFVAPHSWAEIAGWWEKFPDPNATTKPDLTVELARIDVDKAQSVVAKAEADQQLAELELKRGKENATALQTRMDQAKVALFAARTQLKAAEDRLVQVEKERQATARNALWTKRVTRELDGVLLESVWKHARKGDSSDAEFLRRVLLDVTGRAPTTVEEKYFLTDTDPKKREKLLGLIASISNGGDRPKFVDELLADPEVQKRWADLWKQRILKDKEMAAAEAWLKRPTDRLGRLLGQLLDGKKTDDQILDALCLATMARFPTETERKLILDGLKSQPEHRAAWEGVLRALAATQEAKAHAEGLTKRGQK